MSQTGYKRFLNRRKWLTNLNENHSTPISPNTFLSGTHSFQFETYLEKNATINFYLDPEGTTSGTASYIILYNYTGAQKKYKFDVGGIPEGHYNFRIEVVTATGSNDYNAEYIGGSFEPNTETTGSGPYFSNVYDPGSCPL